MRGLLLTLALGSTMVMGSVASAVTGHSEGFENPAFVANQAGNWQDFSGATITRATSGTNGIPSSDGVAHAVLTPGNGPYTTFGGYSSDFGTGFVASLDIFLDPTVIGDDTGFDYSVAVTSQAGAHLRDFIFHVGNVNGDLLVNGDNNTSVPAAVNDFVLLNANGGNNYQVSTAGWYTFEHVFRNDSGVLAVDYNLYDGSNALLWTITRSTPADDIATIVGGNRYGWFSFNDIDGLAIDNTSLQALQANAVPEPATAALGLIGLGGLLVASRRRHSA